MKIKYFIDTNIFLRFLLNDHRELSPKAKKYFALAGQNRAILFSHMLIIAEVFWVLKSFYKFKVNDINKLLTQILLHKNIQVDQTPLILKILKLCEDKNIDFADAFCFLESKQRKIKLITFDKKLSRL